MNFDYDIDVKDILTFNERWPEIDLGPIEGMPHIYPKLDSQLNLIDMSSFEKCGIGDTFNLSLIALFIQIKILTSCYLI